MGRYKTPEERWEEHRFAELEPWEQEKELWEKELAEWKSDNVDWLYWNKAKEKETWTQTDWEIELAEKEKLKQVKKEESEAKQRRRFERRDEEIKQREEWWFGAITLWICGASIVWIFDGIPTLENFFILIKTLIDVTTWYWETPDVLQSITFIEAIWNVLKSIEIHFIFVMIIWIALIVRKRTIWKSVGWDF